MLIRLLKPIYRNQHLLLVWYYFFIVIFFKPYTFSKVTFLDILSNPPSWVFTSFLGLIIFTTLLFHLDRVVRGDLTAVNIIFSKKNLLLNLFTLGGVGISIIKRDWISLRYLLGIIYPIYLIQLGGLKRVEWVKLLKILLTTAAILSIVLGFIDYNQFGPWLYPKLDTCFNIYRTTFFPSILESSLFSFICFVVFIDHLKMQKSSINILFLVLSLYVVIFSGSRIAYLSILIFIFNYFTIYLKSKIFKRSLLVLFCILLFTLISFRHEIAYSQLWPVYIRDYLFHTNYGQCGETLYPANYLHIEGRFDALKETIMYLLGFPVKNLSKPDTTGNSENLLRFFNNFGPFAIFYFIYIFREWIRAFKESSFVKCSLWGMFIAAAFFNASFIVGYNFLYLLFVFIVYSYDNESVRNF